MPFADVRGIKVYYEVRGSGPRLFMISGSGRDLRQTPNVFDSPAAKQYEVLSHDQRGLGRTSRPDTPWTMADYADDANGLLEALGWGRCLVMGTSFGGMVAQEFALRHPDKVERLVLACSSSGGAGGASYPLHEFEPLPLEESVRRQMEVSDTRRDAAWQQANPQACATLMADGVRNKSVGADEPGHAMGARRLMAARKGHDTWERLPQLGMPVLICGGRYDGIAPPDNLEALHRRIKGSQLALFEGGHPFLTQDPRAWPRILAFLQNQQT